MYLHLGQEVVVRFADIIGIFDIETISVSKITKEFFKASESDGRVINVSEELPKSIVVCKKDNRSIVYVTQISSSTLFKRFKNREEII